MCAFTERVINKSNEIYFCFLFRFPFNWMVIIISGLAVADRIYIYIRKGFAHKNYQ